MHKPKFMFNRGVSIMFRTIEAILTVRNDGGSIYLGNGTIEDLDQYSLQKFLYAQDCEFDFSCWCGMNQWYLEASSIVEAVSNDGGKIVAHYRKGKLEINEEKIFHNLVKRIG